MNSFKYSSFKSSKITWCETIPSSWDVQPLLSVVEECLDVNKGLVETNLLSLSYGKIINKDINSNDGLLPESFETYQIVEADDIVLRLTDLQNDKRSLRSAIVRERGIITSAYTAIRSKKIIPNYLNYLLRSYDLTKVFYSMGGGLRQSLSYSDIKRLPIVVPSSDEQKSIARFLDYETVKIDGLVIEQENLVELLREKRLSIIREAVTKGLNTSVKFKSSGIEWANQVPEHWGVDRLKVSVFSCKNGVWGEEALNNEFDIPCVRVADFDRRKLTVKLNNPTIRNITEKERVARILTKGDLLIEKSGGGENQPVGTVVLYDENRESVCSNFIAKIVVREDMSSSYIRYLHSAIYSLRITTKSINQTSGIQNLDQDKYFNERVPYPPRREQDLIATYLDKETSKLDGLMAEAEKVINLLKQRRSSLISAAVTGQIDVRKYAHKEVA